jgi:multidrug efflux pump subunit AcrA (membrane-fusion protein)
MTVDQSVKKAPTGGAHRTLGLPVAQSADPIDRVVRLAPKWTVFVLIACGLLVLGTIIWAVRGTVTSSVSTVGLYNERGAVTVTSPDAVTVDKVLVGLGQQVTAGQELVSIQGGDPLVSPQNGTVSSILVSDGSVMSADQPAVRVTDPAEPDFVVTMVPSSMTGTVVVGLPVRMAVSSAPSSTYGYLLGTVDEISSDPFTIAQVATTLGLEEQVVAAQLGTEPGLLAVIRLEPDPTTVSKYVWSVGQGPPFAITQGVPVTAEIILSETSPIDVVFPPPASAS